MKKIVTSSGAVHYAATEPFQSSEFNGAPYPDGHPQAGEPMFTLNLVLFLDVEGAQVSLVVGHIESITEVVPVQSAEVDEAEASKIVVPKGVPSALLNRND